MNNELAAVQYTPPWGDADKARTDLCHLVRIAALEGAKIIVCPEMAVSGYVFHTTDEIRPFCEPADGQTYQHLSTDSSKIWLLVNAVLPRSDRRVICTTLLW